MEVLFRIDFDEDEECYFECRVGRGRYLGSKSILAERRTQQVIL